MESNYDKDMKQLKKSSFNNLILLFVLLTLTFSITYVCMTKLPNLDIEEKNFITKIPKTIVDLKIYVKTLMKYTHENYFQVLVVYICLYIS